MLSVNIAAYFYRVTDNIADKDIHTAEEKKGQKVFLKSFLGITDLRYRHISKH